MPLTTHLNKIDLAFVKVNNHYANIFYKNGHEFTHICGVEYRDIEFLAKKLPEDISFRSDISFLINQYFEGYKNEYINSLFKLFFHKEVINKIKEILREKKDITLKFYKTIKNGHTNEIKI